MRGGYQIFDLAILYKKIQSIRALREFQNEYMSIHGVENEEKLSYL